MADDTSRIRADIAETQGRLDHTAQALAGELSPRAQAERGLRAAREDPRAIAGAAGAVLLLMLVRRRRRRRRPR